jgi:hypothetical protein
MSRCCPILAKQPYDLASFQNPVVLIEPGASVATRLTDATASRLRARRRRIRRGLLPCLLRITICWGSCRSRVRLGCRRCPGCGWRWSRWVCSGLSARRCSWRSRSRCVGYLIVLQLEVKRRHFERHLVSGVQRRIDLCAQHMHPIVPWVGFQPASSGRRRNLA